MESQNLRFDVKIWEKSKFCDKIYQIKFVLLIDLTLIPKFQIMKGRKFSSKPVLYFYENELDVEMVISMSTLSLFCKDMQEC